MDEATEGIDAIIEENNEWTRQQKDSPADANKRVKSVLRRAREDRHPTGKRNQTLAELTKALKEDPDNELLRQTIGHMTTHPSSTPEEARKAAEEAIVTSPDTPKS